MLAPDAVVGNPAVAVVDRCLAAVAVSWDANHSAVADQPAAADADVTPDRSSPMVRWQFPSPCPIKQRLVTVDFDKSATAAKVPAKCNTKV